MPACDLNTPADPADDLKRTRFAAMIADHFGDRAVELVRAQIEEANGNACAAWRSVLGRMQEIGVDGDYGASVAPPTRRPDEEAPGRHE